MVCAKHIQTPTFSGGGGIFFLIICSLLHTLQLVFFLYILGFLCTIFVYDFFFHFKAVLKFVLVFGLSYPFKNLVWSFHYKSRP